MIHPGDTPGAGKYLTEPLVVSVVSGYLPEGSRGRRGVFAPSAAGAREERVPVPMRDVVCYECGRRTQIPTAALSAHCVYCRAHLNTADVVLKPGSRRLTIRTLGDVSVPSHVALSQLSIVCRNLQVSGKASGSLRCVGSLVLRGQAVVEGQLQAGRVEVASGAQAECSPAVSAESAQVDGHLRGRLHCSGTVTIGSSGALEGDCRAAQLSIASGGRHSGSWIRISP